VPVLLVLVWQQEQLLPISTLHAMLFLYVTRTKELTSGSKQFGSALFLKELLFLYSVPSVRLQM